MALIKLGAIVAAISGKVSGNVFSHNKGGAYVKGWTKPTNPQTVIQQSWRSVFSSISSEWRSLTNNQRSSWEASALIRPVTNRMGETKYLSGYGLYMKQNMVLATTGNASLPDAPVAQAIPDYQIDACSWNYGNASSWNIEMTIVGGLEPLPALTDWMQISVSLPTPSGQKPVLARSLIVVNEASVEATVQTKALFVTIPYAQMIAITGPLSAGDQLLIGASPLNALDPWPTVKRTTLTSITF